MFKKNKWPGMRRTSDVEIGDVDALATTYPMSLSMYAHFKKVGAIDLNRLRANLDIVVAKTKSSGRLTLLGRSEAKLPTSPSEARLETFPNPAPRRNYRIHFETDDFTSVCPITGQPDFARIDIDYVPDRLCVESKSLKFYLASFRNERAFNEAVTNRILDDFVKACAPREAIVTAQFSARGGIALTVRAEHPDTKSRKAHRDGL
jgi:7-cyano-7-deazaguanine reductase